MKDLNSEYINKPNSLEYKDLTKNTFYSLFTNYGALIFQLLSSFLLARLISQQIWGILTLSISFIVLISVISNYFPPAVDYSLNYYIPRFITLNELNNIKPFIRRTLILKIIFLIPIYIISFILFNPLTKIFLISLSDNINILYILSPQILILGLNPIINAIYRIYNMFKLILITTIIPIVLQITLYLLCFLFAYNISLESLAIINTITISIPFIINCLILFFKINRLPDNKKGDIKSKKFNNHIFKYGFPLSFGYLVYGFWDQIQLQGIGFLNTSENVIGYNISLGYSKYSEVMLSSFFYPLFTSFSRLNVKENENQIYKLYNIMMKYALFLTSFISGLLFLLSDFFLFFVFGESYVIFSFLLKYLMISKIFCVIFTPFEALLLAQNKVKYFPILKLTRIAVYLPLFFIGLIYFGLLGGIFGIIISNFINMILYIVLSYKILNIKLDLKKNIFQYVIFFASLIITLVLENLWLNRYNFIFLQFINLSFFNHLPFFSIFTFLVLFLLFNVILRIFSHEDIEQLRSIFIRDNFFDKFIQRILNLIEKILFIK